MLRLLVSCQCKALQSIAGQQGTASLVSEPGCSFDVSFGLTLSRTCVPLSLLFAELLPGAMGHLESSRSSSIIRWPQRSAAFKSVGVPWAWALTLRQHRPFLKTRMSKTQKAPELRDIPPLRLRAASEKLFNTTYVVAHDGLEAKRSCVFATSQSRMLEAAARIKGVEPCLAYCPSSIPRRKS